MQVRVSVSCPHVQAFFLLCLIFGVVLDGLKEKELLEAYQVLAGVILLYTSTRKDTFLSHHLSNNPGVRMGTQKFQCLG